MDENENLQAVLERYSDWPFLFVEPGGNWGDYLIYRGAECLANRVGLNFTSVSFNEFMTRHPEKNTAIYLHGGGAFNSWYRGEDLDALTHALKHYGGPIIQGPHTAEDSDEYIDFMASRIEGYENDDFYVFAREKTTGKNLQHRLADNRVKLRLDHDTALHLTKADLVRESGLKARYRLLALREDVEKPAHDLPLRHYPGLKLDPPRYATSLDHWVKIHALSRSVITNRTHSAIVSAILDIPVTMLPGAYHKNRSIWEYSLRDKGVVWQEWPTSQPDHSPTFLQRAMRRVRHSYKLHQLNLSLMPLRGVPRN